MEEITRGGYIFKDYFNAGLDKKTGICDEEGVDVFDEDTHKFIDSIRWVSTDEIELMDESDFVKLLEDNYIC